MGGPSTIVHESIRAGAPQRASGTLRGRTWRRSAPCSFWSRLRSIRLPMSSAAGSSCGRGAARASAPSAITFGAPGSAPVGGSATTDRPRISCSQSVPRCPPSWSTGSTSGPSFLHCCWSRADTRSFESPSSTSRSGWYAGFRRVSLAVSLDGSSGTSGNSIRAISPAKARSSPLFPSVARRIALS